MSANIRTKRLVLRTPKMGDAPAIARHLNNFAVTGNLSVVPFPYAQSDAEDFIGGLSDEAGPQCTQFLIELEQEGPAGIVGTSDRERGVEIGYWLGEPFWGRGIMSEAVDAVLKWNFAASGAELIVSGAFHFNMASLAIQHKFGFVETGRSERHCVARERDIEHIDTELTREAFEAAHS